MTQLAKKYEAAIDEAVAGLISRAANSRGLETDQVRPRVTAVVQKYLVIEGQEPDKTELRTFIDEIRADDLCLIIACEAGDAGAWEDLVANFDSTVKSA